MTAAYGDPALAARLEGFLGWRHPVAAAAAVTPAGTTTASIGAELAADFEIGSISKGVTGLLYAQALSRREVEESTALGDLLALGPVSAGGVSLGALSTHRSGLPSLPRSAAPLRRTIALWRTGVNPYGETLAELLDQARGVRLARPVPRYSNFGFELLGHALAAAAGTTYPELIRRRVAEPLGASTLYAPANTEELSPTALPGRNRAGKPQEPWTGEALAPAGGLRASITDMARLTGALLDGTAPGITALDPIAPFGRKTRIGAAWITLEQAGREITWHNGGTGGFRSWLGLDRQADTGVVLLTATSASVDRHGFALLTDIAKNGMG